MSLYDLFAVLKKRAGSTYPDFRDSDNYSDLMRFIRLVGEGQQPDLKACQMASEFIYYTITQPHKPKIPKRSARHWRKEARPYLAAVHADELIREGLKPTLAKNRAATKYGFKSIRSFEPLMEETRKN